MKNTTKYGMIGCGMMGHEHLRNIALLDSAEVVAIFEPDQRMATSALHTAPDACLQDSIAAMLDVQDLDCLVISSPNYCHMSQLLEIAERRPLPVLVEKPLFTSSSDVTALEDFQQSFPAPVWVGMEYRYMPPISAFISEVDAATGGVKMLTIREHRFPFLEKVGDWNRFNAQTGGTFVEKCCHFFDLMRLLMKSEPIRVMASAGQDVNHLSEEYHGKVPDILDNGFVLLDFANGSRAMLELCMFAEGSEYQEEIWAIGPVGKLETRVPGPNRFWPEHLGKAPTPQMIHSPRNPQGPVVQEIPVDQAILDVGDHNGATFFQHERFLALVRGDLPAPDVSLEDGKKAVLIGMAAQQSAITGKAVDLNL